MVWRALFKKSPEPEEPATSPTDAPNPLKRSIPPHLAQAIEKRTPGVGQPVSDPAERKLAGLRRQRLAILFDIEQGELAASPDNPWTDRMSLLTEAMATVTDDIATASEIEPGPFFPLPQTPIAIGRIEAGDAAIVEFSVGDELFAYTEDIDWAERGHQITRSELVRRSGDVSSLIPNAVPDDLRQALTDHAGDSLFVFASDLRDRKLDEEAIPGSPTLADLSAPCPVCGGWIDWRGTCQACARRTADVAGLKREEGRLLSERAAEAEERHRLVEGLPLARKRLRDVEADLVRLGDTIP